jgi:hypothetical protein
MDWKAAAKMGALALNASISKAASVPLHLVVERSGKKLPLTMQGENATASGTLGCGSWFPRSFGRTRTRLYLGGYRSESCPCSLSEQAVVGSAELLGKLVFRASPGDA